MSWSWFRFSAAGLKQPIQTVAPQSKRVLVAQTPHMQGPANLLGEEDDPRTDESEVDDPRTGGDDETHRRPTMTGKGKAGNDANGDDAKGNTGNRAKGKAGNDANGKAGNDAKGQGET